MSKLIVTTFVSLDGVMEAPGGEPGYPHTGWVIPYFDDTLMAYKQAEQLAVDVLLLGRVMYPGFAESWSQRDGAMADKINTMQKYVVSTTLQTPEPAWTGTGVLHSTDDVAARKAAGGGDLLVIGSRTLAQSLLRAGLVDRLNLQVFPLVLGSGAKLLPEAPDPLALTLEHSATTDKGVMLQEYRVG